MFHIGQRVVCVRGANLPNKFNAPLVEGRIYTIRWIGPAWDHGTLATGVALEEIVGRFYGQPPRGGLPEHKFHPTRFRPVHDRKTDISIFTDILDRVNKREPVAP